LLHSEPGPEELPGQTNQCIAAAKRPDPKATTVPNVSLPTTFYYFNELTIGAGVYSVRAQARAIANHTKRKVRIPRF